MRPARSSKWAKMYGPMLFLISITSGLHWRLSNYIYYMLKEGKDFNQVISYKKSKSFS